MLSSSHLGVLAAAGGRGRYAAGGELDDLPVISSCRRRRKLLTSSSSLRATLLRAAIIARMRAWFWRAKGEHYFLAKLGIDVFLGELGNELFGGSCRYRRDRARCRLEARKVEWQQRPFDDFDCG